jgi:hypothetical protein
MRRHDAVQRAEVRHGRATVQMRLLSHDPSLPNFGDNITRNQHMRLATEHGEEDTTHNKQSTQPCQARQDPAPPDATADTSTPLNFEER